MLGEVYGSFLHCLIFRFIFVVVPSQGFIVHVMRADSWHVCLPMSRSTHHSSMAGPVLMTPRPSCWNSPQHGTYAFACSASEHSTQTSWPLATGTSETLTLLSQDVWVCGGVPDRCDNLCFRAHSFLHFPWLTSCLPNYHIFLMIFSCHLLWSQLVGDDPSMDSSGLLDPSHLSPSCSM